MNLSPWESLKERKRLISLIPWKLRRGQEAGFAKKTPALPTS